MSAVDVPEVFRRLVAEPMRKVDAKLDGFAGRIVAVFDALDECVGVERPAQKCYRRHGEKKCRQDSPDPKTASQVRFEKQSLSLSTWTIKRTEKT